MPFGLLASGVRGEATNNMKSTGTVATSRSNRAALKRRVFTRCKNNKNGSCSSESVEEAVEEETVEEETVEEGGGESTEIFEDLTNPSQVNVVSSGGNKYVLNGNTTYNQNTRYYLYNGIYELQSIPTGHPMAIISNSNQIEYTGTESNKSIKNVDGVSYNFYHGDITITVNGDFETASLYCYNHGYMGGQDVLIYNGLPSDAPEDGPIV